jgi:hypothetical protein
VKRALAVALLVAQAARAESPDEDARRLYRAGVQAFDEGRLDVAESSFEAAYRLAPRPALLFDLAQTHRRRFVLTADPQLLARAVDEYRRYVAEAPTGSNRGFAESMLAELTPLLARLRPELVGGPPAPPVPPPRTELMIFAEASGAGASLDGGPRVPLPLIAETRPGAHRARVDAPGYFPTEMSLNAVEARLVTAEARLAPRPARLAIQTQAGALVVVDGKAVGRAPLAPVSLAAGEHALEVTARGHRPFTAPVVLARDSLAHIDATLAPTAQRRAVRWLLGAAGALVAGAIGGAAAWGQADAAAGDLDHRRQTTGITLAQLAEYNADRARRDEARVATSVLLSIGGALAITAGGLWLFDSPTGR